MTLSFVWTSGFKSRQWLGQGWGGRVKDLHGEKVSGALQVALEAAEVSPSASLRVWSSDSERTRVVLTVRFDLWVLKSALCSQGSVHRRTLHRQNPRVTQGVSTLSLLVPAEQQPGEIHSQWMLRPT